MTRLYSGAGHLVEPGKTLGRGGEGTVHEIAGRPGFVAKVYHQPVGPDKALKLEGMVRQAHPSLLEIAAWPVDVLRVRPDGPVQGFVMPRVNGYHEIHSLYGPSHRKRTFPHADWSFLVHAARNLASAFETIHARGNVIGDVNPGNVVVSAQALVKLIDCDSFQIDTGDRLFLCDVGVPQFTAPELQDRSFHGLRRTPDHDAFGLALLCFHLLFMGRHPFAGRYRGKGDMPIECAIKENRFAFGRHAVGRLMEPPPHTLPLDALPQAIADLFERAFDPVRADSQSPHGAGLAAGAGTTRPRTAHLRPERDAQVPGTVVGLSVVRAGTSQWNLILHSPASARTGQPASQPPRFPSRPGLEPYARGPTAHRRSDARDPERRAPVTPTPLPEPLRRAQRDNLIKTAAIAGVALIAILVQPHLSWLWLPLAAVAWPLTQDSKVRREYQRRRLALLAARRELTDLRAAWQQRADGSAVHEQTARPARPARPLSEPVGRPPAGFAAAGDRPAPASTASVPGRSFHRPGPDSRHPCHRPDGAGILWHRDRRRCHSPPPDRSGSRLWPAPRPPAGDRVARLASGAGTALPLRSPARRQSRRHRRSTTAICPTAVPDRARTADGPRRTG
ncbi:MAG: hypothetical protein MZV65_30660 [Chromatiales bacterium]|nr:hypothetical protein [Chromatiales bacterium]